MQKLIPVLIVAFLFCISSLQANAGELSVDVRFSSNEASIILDFYRQSTSSRGKGRGRSLPPGIAKNLARGKPLPPGIAKQALPGDLLGRLPPVHDGYERIVVGGKVLLVEIATQVIHDVLVDAIL